MLSSGINKYVFCHDDSEWNYRTSHKTWKQKRASWPCLPKRLGTTVGLQRGLRDAWPIKGWGEMGKSESINTPLCPLLHAWRLLNAIDFLSLLILFRRSRRWHTVWTRPRPRKRELSPSLKSLPYPLVLKTIHWYVDLFLYCISLMYLDFPYLCPLSWFTNLLLWCMCAFVCCISSFTWRMTDLRAGRDGKGRIGNYPAVLLLICVTSVESYELLCWWWPSTFVWKKISKRKLKYSSLTSKSWKIPLCWKLSKLKLVGSLNFSPSWTMKIQTWIQWLPPSTQQWQLVGTLAIIIIRKKEKKTHLSSLQIFFIFAKRGDNWERKGSNLKDLRNTRKGTTTSRGAWQRQKKTA